MLFDPGSCSIHSLCDLEEVTSPDQAVAQGAGQDSPTNTVWSEGWQGTELDGIHAESTSVLPVKVCNA